MQAAVDGHRLVWFSLPGEVVGRRRHQQCSRGFLRAPASSVIRRHNAAASLHGLIPQVQVPLLQGLVIGRISRPSPYHSDLLEPGGGVEPPSAPRRLSRDSTGIAVSIGRVPSGQVGRRRCGIFHAVNDATHGFRLYLLDQVPDRVSAITSHHSDPRSFRAVQAMLVTWFPVATAGDGVVAPVP